jgi:arsenate reductase
MERIKIWHNCNCSKSREAKKILEEQNVPHGTFEYLKENLTKKDIIDIKNRLGFSDIKDMLRKKEEEYINLGIETKSEEEIIPLLIQHPILIERPIIIKGTKAVIARPMENLLDLLKG